MVNPRQFLSIRQPRSRCLGGSEIVRPLIELEHRLIADRPRRFLIDRRESLS